MNALRKNYSVVRSDDLALYSGGLRAEFAGKVRRMEELLAYNARAGRTPPPVVHLLSADYVALDSAIREMSGGLHNMETVRIGGVRLARAPHA